MLPIDAIIAVRQARLRKPLYFSHLDSLRFDGDALRTLSHVHRLDHHPHGSPELRDPPPVIAGTADIAVNGSTGRAIVRS